MYGLAIEPPGAATSRLRTPCTSSPPRTCVSGRAQRGRSTRRHPRARRPAPAHGAGEDASDRYNVEVDHAPAAHRLPRNHHAARPRATTRHKKQTGGAGQFGEVYLRVEPLATRRAVRVRQRGRRRRDPAPAHPGRREGRSAGAGPRAPLPATRCGDVRVTVYDGKHHTVDSKEVAFVPAGRKAFIDAVVQGQAGHPRADRRHRHRRAQQ